MDSSQPYPSFIGHPSPSSLSRSHPILSSNSHSHSQSSSSSSSPSSSHSKPIQPSSSSAPNERVLCNGCKNTLEDATSIGDSVVVSFGNSLWHVDCFRCAKCRNLVEHDTNLLLLSDGSPVCENCSYICSVCKLPISNEAIVTGEESYHAECFRCKSCSNRIEELIFAKTSQGIYCMTCHNERVTRSRRHAEAKRTKSANSSSKKDRDHPHRSAVSPSNPSPQFSRSKSKSSSSSHHPHSNRPPPSPNISNSNQINHSLPISLTINPPGFDPIPSSSRVSPASPDSSLALGAPPAQTSLSSASLLDRESPSNSNSYSSRPASGLPSLPLTPRGIASSSFSQSQWNSSLSNSLVSHQPQLKLTSPSTGSHAPSPKSPNYPLAGDQAANNPSSQISRSVSNLGLLRSRGGSTSSDGNLSLTSLAGQRASVQASVTLPTLYPASNVSSRTGQADQTVIATSSSSPSSSSTAYTSSTQPLCPSRPSTSDGALSPTLSVPSLTSSSIQPADSPLLNTSPQFSATNNRLGVGSLSDKSNRRRSGFYGSVLIPSHSSDGVPSSPPIWESSNLSLPQADSSPLGSIDGIPSQASPDEQLIPRLKSRRTSLDSTSNVQLGRSSSELTTTPKRQSGLSLPRPASGSVERPLSYYDPEVLFSLDRSSPSTPNGPKKIVWGLDGDQTSEECHRGSREPAEDLNAPPTLSSQSPQICQPSSDGEKVLLYDSPNHQKFVDVENADDFPELVQDMTLDVELIEQVLKELEESKERMKLLQQEYISVERTGAPNPAEGFSADLKAFVGPAALSTPNVSNREEVELSMDELKSKIMRQARRLEEIKFLKFSEPVPQRLRKGSLHGLEKYLSRLAIEKQSLSSVAPDLNDVGLDHDPVSLNSNSTVVSEGESDLLNKFKQIRNAYQVQVDDLISERDQLKLEISHLAKVRESHVKELSALNQRQDTLAELNAAAMRQLEEIRATFTKGGNSKQGHSSNGMIKGLLQSPTTAQLSGMETGSSDDHHGQIPVEVNIATTRKFKWGKNHAQKAMAASGHAANRVGFGTGGGSGSSSATLHLSHSKNAASFSALDSVVGTNLTNNNSNQHITNPLHHHHPQGVVGVLRPHNFQPVSVLRPVRCDYCGDKLWGLAEVRCAVCGSYSHSKCAPNFFGCQASNPLPHSTAGWANVPEEDQLPSHSSQQSVSGNSAQDTNHSVGVIFGKELESLARLEKVLVPRIVTKCIDAVDQHGLQFEGIYRKTGGMSSVKMIQSSFEKGTSMDLNDLDKFNDISAITSALKNYFRQLPNPLFTFELHEAFVAVAAMTPETVRLEALERVIYQLPVTHFETLKVLMNHLSRIESNSAMNKMTSQNLGVVFGPTLLRSNNPTRQFSDMPFTAKIVELTIINAAGLFKKPHQHHLHDLPHQLDGLSSWHQYNGATQNGSSGYLSHQQNVMSVTSDE